ncbi:MAG: hypothetical protein NUV98_06190 [Candidatus Roizmanbacteria bacterium]|nr:hypothetical protein [Candidatus Roizmanbacteria bacterium]
MNNKTNDDNHDDVPVSTPQIRDEDSSSGSTPAPSSDDNVLDAAHAAGLYEDADEENPKPLNIAEEIEKDEKTHREK